MASFPRGDFSRGRWCAHARGRPPLANRRAARPARATRLSRRFPRHPRTGMLAKMPNYFVTLHTARYSFDKKLPVKSYQHDNNFKCHFKIYEWISEKNFSLAVHNSVLNKIRKIETFRFQILSQIIS